jgi:hypothetical protein
MIIQRRDQITGTDYFRSANVISLYQACLACANRRFPTQEYIMYMFGVFRHPTHTQTYGF